MPHIAGSAQAVSINAQLGLVWPPIAGAIDARYERMVKLRRRLHATPEPSGQEKQTTALIADALATEGLSPRVMQNETGVVVDVNLNDSGPTSYVALRSELDCVQVDDDKQVAYASTRPGLCHACGHDAHSTILLAAAIAAHEHRAALREVGLKQSLRFIFQPAEENATGARSMIKQGALDSVEAIIAVHVWPFLDAGVIGLRKGPITAACKVFEITVTGKSGHSARPHDAIDPIPAAINLVSMLYQLCPRSVDSQQAMTITVGSIVAGQTFNAIPDDAKLSGTLRTLRVADMETCQRKMEAVCKGVAEATGCQIKLDLGYSCPATDNDPAIVAAMERIIPELTTHTGKPVQGHWLEQSSLGGEDFAFYQELIPGAIVRLGTGLADPQKRKGLHSSLFDINEAAMPVGAKFLLRSALELARA